MKKIVFLFLTVFLILLNKSWAQQVDVEVSPPEPIVNESFFVTFKIKSTGNVDPYISFTPIGASVQGKSEQGVSISTIVINGKFTTTREQNYVYELIAERPGQIMLKNIKVEIAGKVTSLKDVSVNVLSQPRRIPDAFIEATASKTKVYLGEGIDVNYYLYFKTAIAANDVKEFPKLNKFIKRFHHINSPVETVQYKGQIFKRILAYSARLYPEKVGTAVLDPMIISVQIVENDYSNPFGGFGLGAQRYKNKDLSSSRIDVEVMPLPAENVPPGFTGLVGEHEFSLSIPKTKFLVNEPVEVKLEVKGKGALENMDAPTIYTDNNLEQFDTKSEVTELGSQAAKKVFEYTFLPRGPMSIKERELPLAYFDPASGRYVEKKVTVPGIEVSGVAASPGAGTANTQAKAKDQPAASEDDFLSKLFSPSRSKTVEKNPIGLVAPVMNEKESIISRWFDVINIAFSLLIIAGLGSWFYGSKNVSAPKGHSALVKEHIAILKKHGMNYSDLYRVIASLDTENKMAGGGVSINSIIDESRMSQEARNYFKNALIVCEEKSFGVNKAERKVNFENKYFKELINSL